MASRASKETWASRAIGGRSAHLVPEGRTVPKVPRDEAVRTATPVLWDPLGRRANSESQDCQATQEDRGQRVLSDFLDFLAPTEKRAAGAPLGSRDRGGSEARRAHEVKEAHGASPGSLAPRATLEAMARLALPVNGDPTDPKDPRGSLDQRAPRGPQARTGSRDTLDSEARRVSKARPALQALRVWSALRVPLGKPVPWASVVTLAPQGPPVNRGSRAWPGKKGRRETQAPPAFLGKTVPPGCEASLETEDFLVQWGRLD